VFFSKTDSTDLDTNGSANGSSSTAARNAAVAARNAASAAQAAAQNAAMAATNAAQSAGSASQSAVLGARKWAAPQLETVADYCTTTVAPMISSALRSTAQRVRPVEVAPRRRVPSALTWSLLAAAILAALGAAAALVRYRYRTAMATDSEDEALTVPSPDTDETRPQAPMDATTTSGDTSVNGRVSATGW
jgi:trimeric autotransporter adhesin